MADAVRQDRGPTPEEQGSRIPTGLGKLSWQPALAAPQLLAEPVRQVLVSGTVDPNLVFVTAIDPTLADTAEFCAAFDTPLTSSANCVVVAGHRGEVAKTAACLVLATDKADVNKTVRKHLGVRKLSFASMDDAVSRTGMEYGGITPVGLPSDWPILVDSNVTHQDWIVIGSGIRGSKLAIPGEMASRLPGAAVLDLTI